MEYAGMVWREPEDIVKDGRPLVLLLEGGRGAIGYWSRWKKAWIKRVDRSRITDAIDGWMYLAEYTISTHNRRC